MKRRALLLLALAAAGAQGEERLELNRASRAELESLPGLGPQKVEVLLNERQRAAFRDWRDLRARVKGIGPKIAQRLSDAGLRVAGQAYAAASDATP